MARKFRREVGRIAVNELGEGAQLVMMSMRATRDQAFLHEAPTVVASMGGTSVEFEAPVAEVEALIEYVVESIGAVEGVDGLDWSMMSDEYRREFVEEFGITRIAMIYKYFTMLRMHTANVTPLPERFVTYIATGVLPPEPEPREEEKAHKVKLQRERHLERLRQDPSRCTEEE